MPASLEGSQTDGLNPMSYGEAAGSIAKSRM